MRANEIINEAANRKRQAAIAIAMQKAGKKPKQGVAEGYDPVESDYQQWEDILVKDGYRGDPSGAYALELVVGHQLMSDPAEVASTIRNILTYVKQNRQVLGKAVSDRKTVKDAIIDIKNKFPQQYQAAQQPQGMAEGENWSKHNNKRVGGMSKKSVSSYRRSHPGSKIQTAVTTKPSKIKKGSKDAKRRASFCARMKGMKKHRTSAKTARDPNSNINKSLRRWNCESIEQMQELVMIAEQFIRDNKK